MTTTEGDEKHDAEASALELSAANGDHTAASTTEGAAESATTAPARPVAERKMSISEQASAGSTGRYRAPAFLRWFEYPFRVKNCQTGAYLGEATGHSMDVCARGPINQTGSFVGSSVIRLAAMQAGGPNETIYGFQASSLLTVGTIIVGITAGLTMPFVGSLVDHTDHRKAMGSVSALIIVLSVGAQLMLDADTWFAVWILEMIGGYFLILHQVCTMAYLPDLSHDLTEMGHYTSRFMQNQYFVQGIYTTIIVVVSWSASMTNIGTSKFAVAMATALGVLCFGYSWIFLFRRRPRLRELPPGHNIVTTGVVRLFQTTKKVFREYKALRWFMVALLFSPEAGAGVVLAIAVTFLTFFVKMTVKEIASVSLTMLYLNIVGAWISKKMCQKINPLNSFRLAELMFATVNALIAITVTGSTDRDKALVYFYAALMGIAFGWMFPSQRTLAVALVPKGQETEIMGLISFFGQVLGWLPVMVFTAMNENGVSMRWGLASVSFFLVISFLITLLCGNFHDAVALVEHTSADYLNSYQKKASLTVAAGGGGDEKANAAQDAADGDEKAAAA